MSIKKPVETKKVMDTIYKCPRCRITSEGKQMCPCPRGGCEAVRVKIPKRNFTRKQTREIARKAYLLMDQVNPRGFEKWFEENY